MAIDNDENEGSAAGPETTATWPVRVTRPGIKKTIAVMSGKGGVGKSALTILLAAGLRRKGLEVGILDADITGPSIPMGLGMTGPVYFDQKGPAPVASRGGIKVISMNLLLPDENKAVIWRGPIITSVVRQFYEDYDWGELDYLLVDLPPGTADVPLTVMQSIPLDGIVLVISPQELAGMIVGKARNMAASMDVPVIGLVENMSYAVCEHCGERVEPFGASHSEEAANAMGIPLLGRLPLDPEMSRLADEGRLDEYRSEQVEAVVDALLEQASDLTSPV